MSSDDQTPQKDHPGINIPNKFGVASSKMNGRGNFQGGGQREKQTGPSKVFKGLQSSRTSSTAQLLHGRQAENQGELLHRNDLMTQILLQGGSLRGTG